MDIILPQPLNLNSITYSRASIASTRGTDGIFKIVGANELRFDYFMDSSEVSTLNGVLIEPFRVNYLRNTASNLTPGSGTPINVSSQTVVMDDLGLGSPKYLTLSFYGTGSVTVTGGGFSYSLTGRNNTDGKPAYKTFPTRASVLDVVVTGQVYAANLEGVPIFTIGSGAETDEVVLTRMTRPTSWIPTTSSPAVRAADEVTASGLIWSTFTESYTAWDGTVTYSLGDIITKDFFRWSSTSDGNIGNEPSVSSTAWVKVQSINSVALIDRKENSTSIIEQGSLGAYFSYTAKIDYPEDFLKRVPDSLGKFFDSAAIVEVSAKVAELVVSVSTSAGVFTKVVKGDSYSGSLANTGVVDDVYEFLSRYFVLSVYSCTVSLRLHNGVDRFSGQIISPSLKVSIGELLFGKLQNLGKTAYGMRTGIIDYSKKETNEFGVTTFVKRGFSKTMSCSVYVENKDYNRVVETLQNVLAEPTAWIGTDAAEYSNGSIIFGAFKDFNIVISYPTYSMLDIEVQGLVV